MLIDAGLIDAGLIGALPRLVAAAPDLSWDLRRDLELLLQYPFMRNAFIAGSVVALMCGAIGWFAVLRGETYAAHTLASVAFPGASGAVYLGLPAFVGYFGFAVAGAGLIAWLSPSGAGRLERHSATVGAVQAMALALGFWFVSLYRGFFSSLSGFLFGSFLGVTRDDVMVLTVTAVAALAVLVIIGRPLLFASIDPRVAEAAGVPVRTVSLVYLILLGCAVAEAAQFTGVLLVLALVVVPAATASVLTARPAAGLALSVGLALCCVWVGLAAAYFTDRPVGFWVTTVGFAGYVLARGVAAARSRLSRRVVVA
jgi:zinc/manganese transport system permease protein